MAVSRYIPKDIKKYKPKYFWGFTTRQVISLVITAVLVAVSLKLLGESVPAETRIYVCSLPAAVPLLFGFVPVYGMPLERFIPEVFHDYFRNSPRRYRITAPSLRLAKTKKQGAKPDKNKKMKEEPYETEHETP